MSKKIFFSSETDKGINYGFKTWPTSNYFELIVLNN